MKIILTNQQRSAINSAIILWEASTEVGVIQGDVGKFRISQAAFKTKNDIRKLWQPKKEAKLGVGRGLSSEPWAGARSSNPNNPQN